MLQYSFEQTFGPFLKRHVVLDAYDRHTSVGGAALTKFMYSITAVAFVHATPFTLGGN